MKECICKREYVFLYLTKFCFSVANTLIDVFGAVMLYKNGMELYLILLVYGIRFGIMGLCTPLFLTISKKFGIGICALLANILRVIGSYMILTGDYNHIIVFILVMSLPGAISNPIEDAMSSKYVKEEHRGKYNSILNVVRILGQAFASIMVAYGVINNNYYMIYLITIIFFFLDFLFTSLVSYKPNIEQHSVLKQTIQYCMHKKSVFKKIYFLRTFHIIERLFMPLYVYIMLEDFQLFSAVMIISLIIQIVPVIIIGITTDKNIKKTNGIVSILKIIISAIFIFVKNKFIISFNKTVNDNLEKIYETNVQASIQNIITKSQENNTLLSAIGQMILCITECVVFIGFSLMTTVIHIEIFKIIFVLSIIATIAINRNIVKSFNSTNLKKN